MMKKQLYEFNPRTSLGGTLPYVVYLKEDKAHVFPFHISSTDFHSLVQGTGKCYGRSPYGPWQKLRLYRYVIVGREQITNIEELKRIEEWFSYLCSVENEE